MHESPSDSVTELSFIQLLNALLPKETTEEGIVIEVKLVQNLKAFSPIDITPSEMTTLIKL